MSFIIDVKVIPASGRQFFFLDKSEKLKCYLKNPPEKGKANDELIKLISKKLSLPKSNIEIVLGAKDRNKKIKIDTNLSYDEILLKLGVEKQLKIN
ncbi:MAG: DUF167 domain-containing protein [bacterium]